MKWKFNRHIDCSRRKRISTRQVKVEGEGNVKKKRQHLSFADPLDSWFSLELEVTFLTLFPLPWEAWLSLTGAAEAEWDSEEWILFVSLIVAEPFELLSFKGLESKSSGSTFSSAMKRAYLFFTPMP